MAEEIRAEIVAQVRTVFVKEGEYMAAGDEILLLESMKMEIPVLSESAGKLAALPVREGDVVQEGTLLAVVG